MTEYTGDDTFAVYSRISKEKYDPYRNKLEELGYPRAGHMAKIYKVNNSLFEMAIGWFMNLDEKEKSEFLEEAAGDKVVLKQSKWFIDNKEKRAKYKKEWYKKKHGDK